MQAFELRKIEALSFVVWRFALGCTLGAGLEVTMRSAWKRSWQSLTSLCSNERVVAGRGTQHFSHVAIARLALTVGGCVSVLSLKLKLLSEGVLLEV